MATTDHLSAVRPPDTPEAARLQQIERRLANLDVQVNYLVSSAKRLEELLERVRKAWRAASTIIKHVKI
jgi:predicted ATP-grasp superfamily ATP-dependent carboligase